MSGAAACGGGFIGYGFDFADLGARARFDFAALASTTAPCKADVCAYDLDLRLYHVWDLSMFFFELGLGGGASLWTQRFVAENIAPRRTLLAPLV